MSRSSSRNMSQSHNSQIISVAIGAAIGVIGAASLFIYQKIIEHRERGRMMDNLESVNRRVSQLQVALDNMSKAQQEQQKTKKGKNVRKRMASANNFCSSETDIEIDGISVTETDIDDEFYDCSDDEAAAERLDNEPAGVMELSRQLAALDERIEREEMHEEVLCDLRSLVIWYDANVEVIWRLARACFKNANNLTDAKRQDILLQEGMQLCEKVLHEEHANLHKWYAMLVGLTTEHLPMNERLKAGKRFEKHTRLSLKLQPKDSILNHMLGRFQYTVSGLSWIEKKICETLFGEVPISTYDEAIEHLEKAEEYATEPNIENKYFLAKSYLKIKKYQKCVDLLKELNNLSARNLKQKAMQSEAMKLITTYSSYCS